MNNSVMKKFKFTSREKDIIAFIIHKESSCEIADILGISRRTVENHLQNIYNRIFDDNQDYFVQNSTIQNALSKGKKQLALRAFIKNSNQTQKFYNLYLDLIAEHCFKSAIDKISIIFKDKNIKVDIDTKDPDHNIKFISKVFKKLPLKIINNSTSANGYYKVRLLSQDSVANFEEKTIFIANISQDFTSLNNPNILDFSSKKELYNSCFKLLQRLLPHEDLSPFIKEFEECKSRIYHLSSNLQEDGLTPNKPKQSQNTKIFFTALITIIITCFFVSYIAVQTYFKQNSQNKIFNFVKPVSYFVGRAQETDNINFNLHKYGKASILGISGIGKTQIVRKYVEQNKDKYDIIWFLDTNLDSNISLVKLAYHINELEGRKVVSTISSTVKQDIMFYLSQRSNWLLIFDNLKVNQNNKVKDFIEWENNGHIIFCSQDSNNLPNSLPIHALTKAEAIKLTNKILINKSPEIAEFLVKNFQGYPVMIVQGAQLIQSMKGLSMDEYKKQIYHSANKVKMNINIALQELSQNARDLSYKIALLNTQGFSKELLKIITNNSDTLESDIYHIQNLGLIELIDTDDENSVFQMHDVVSQTIVQINSESINKNALEDLTDKLVGAVPQAVNPAHIFRNSKTILDNFQIIKANAEKYGLPQTKVMSLSLQLLLHYINSFDNHQAKKLLDYFEQQDKEGHFDLKRMDNDEKSRYAIYLEMIGIYYRNFYGDWHKALDYFKKSVEAFESVEKYEAFKYNAMYMLSAASMAVGDLEQAKNNINKSTEMFDTGLVSENDLGFLLFSQGVFMFRKGMYSLALTKIDEAIENYIANGFKPNDIGLTALYLMKADTLNYLGKYQEACDQSEQLLKMHKDKKPEHEIFGRIYTHLAKADLGLKNIPKASKEIDEAIAILEDQQKEGISIDLSNSYIVKGDILTNLEFYEDAVSFYLKAYDIYQNFYRTKINNIAQTSYLYTQGAYASFKGKNQDRFEQFKKLQLEGFGMTHPNTLHIINTCIFD